jgi:MFS family permease
MTLHCLQACRLCPIGNGQYITLPRLIYRYFDHPTGNRLGLYAASLYIPSIPAAFLGDVVADKFGRRVAIYIGSIIVIAGSLLNSLAINVPMWIAGRSSPLECR